jgi:subtilisin family serine protease
MGGGHIVGADPSLFHRLAFAGLAVLIFAAPARADEFTNSKQLNLIGVTDALQKSANNGAGVKVGDIDTGIMAKQVEFTGRVDPSGTCIMKTGCKAGAAFADDNGHGTMTAGIIGAAKGNGGMVGVAPGVTILPVKVLNAQGSGYFTDVARGIRYAADHGVGVVNLSLTFGMTSEMVSAMNYAASKGVVMVYAGGNSATAFLANGVYTGLSADAVKSLLLVGATDYNKKLAYFSNTPGKGGFRAGSTVTPFANIWLDAPGVNIISAYNAKDSANGLYDMYAMGSGTSFAAPQVTGAIALLESRWAFLGKNHTATQILLLTAQDLGAMGIDSVYGTGFLDVAAAFNPIGPLSLYTGGTPQSPTTAQIVASGPMGRLSRLSAQLKGVALLDSFGRDFPADLSGNVTAKQPSAGLGVVPASVTTRTTQQAARLQDGSRFTAAVTTDDDPTTRWGLTSEEGAGTLSRTPQAWSFAFSSATGDFVAGGHGAGFAGSFDEGLFGASSGLTRTSMFAPSGASVSTALLGFADASSYGVVAAPVAAGRLAVAFSSSSDDTLDAVTGGSATADGGVLGYSFTLGETWQMGLTAGALAETNELLGAVYAGSLALGRDSRSYSLGVSTSFSLDDVLPTKGFKLAFDAVVARTDPGSPQGSLITGASAIESLGFGAALAKDQLFDEQDSLALGIKKPLRAYAGTANLVVPVGTDADGNVVTEKRSASLVPSGNETDLDLTYGRRFLMPDVMTTFGLQFRKDADQVAGHDDVRATLALDYRF